MRKMFILLLFISLKANLSIAEPPFAKWSKTELFLNNGVVQRTIKLPVSNDTYLTTLYKPVIGDFKYFKKELTDFQMEVENVLYSGRGKWSLVAIQPLTDSKSGDGAAVTLISEDKKVQLTIKYLLYPSLPVIRKSIVVRNLTNQTVKLESVDVEKFEVIEYWPATFSWICHDYGRRRSIGPYEGDIHDALVTVHNSDWRQGIVIGNEASGVVKRTSAFWETLDISTGLTHKNSLFPFRKWIPSGASFETPQVFTMVYNDHKDPDEMLNTVVPDFVRKHMGIRLSELKQKPTYVYNTWIPFREKINEKLVMELAKAAADAGMKEFIIDDGWESNFGDWEIDKNKFPNGLKPVFDYIKSLGMKPGLWVSVGSASPSSKVYRNHPEWFVLDEAGKYTNLHIQDTTIRTACFGTGWYDYIKSILLKLSNDYGLEYMKLDFTVVTSPYRYNNKESGCYAIHHEGHRDHHESLFTNYERVWQLFDELHAAAPNLFIDCTFETMGGMQLIDYALLKHAEGDWLSNFGGPDEKVDLRIRNMAWWRSPAIPATALVIGNPEMQDAGWEMHIKSIAGALPIMLGDPRKLSPADLKKYRGYADWLQAMENKHDIMNFRQDLAGFGEPLEGMWDGFQRINTDTKSGGIVGVFKQGAIETERQVSIQYLVPEKIYTIREAVSGKVIKKLTGEQLAKTGFKVIIAEQYGGQLFEIALD